MCNTKSKNKEKVSNLITDRSKYKPVVYCSNNIEKLIVNKTNGKRWNIVGFTKFHVSRFSKRKSKCQNKILRSCFKILPF